MIDYSKNDPKGWCGDPTRGAAMGRANINTNSAPKGPLTVQHVHLDDGGYDRNGTYWGFGQPLYFVSGEDDDGNDIEVIFRADSLGAAKKEAAEMFEGARIIEGEDIEVEDDDDSDDDDYDSEDDDYDSEEE